MTEKTDLEAKKLSTKKASQVAKTESVQSVTSEKKKPNTETLMYIGTSLSAIGLQQNALFKNGVPKAIEQHIEKCPAIGALLVPISRLSEARNSLKVKGTAEFMLNEQAVSYGRGEI